MLRSIIISFFVLFLLILVSGCGSFNNLSRDYPEGLMHGAKYSVKSEKDNPYKIESKVWFGKEYYVVNRPTNNPNNLPFVIWPSDSTTRIINLDGSGMDLFCPYDFVPIKQFFLNGSPITKLHITDIKSPVVKANLTKEYGLLVTTESGAKYKFVVFQSSNGTDYLVLESEECENKLPLWILEYDSTKLKIEEKDGSLSLENLSIYKPTLKEHISKSNLEEEIIKKATAK